MHETRGKDVTTLPWQWLQQWSRGVVGDGDGWNERAWNDDLRGEPIEIGMKRKSTRGWEEGSELFEKRGTSENREKTQLNRKEESLRRWGKKELHWKSSGMADMGTFALGFLYFPSLPLLILSIICCGLDLVESKLASHLLCSGFFLVSLISPINEWDIGLFSWNLIFV